MRVVITGGIACGKSQAGCFLADQGWPVIEADELAHAVLRRGEDVYAAVRREFGDGILGEQGEIDRAVLGRVVFSDLARLTRLNALVHPEVLRRLRTLVDEAAGWSPVAVAVVPLVFELGREGEWDQTVCVAAPESDVLARLAARGLNEEEAHRRLAAQLPLEQKMERADRVLFNGGSLGLLRAQALRLAESWGAPAQGRRT